jgi:hypothetical protein
MNASFLAIRFLCLLLVTVVVVVVITQATIEKAA